MNLAIIPARGGSKRITGKNIATVGGKPLIYWSIQAAKASKSIDRIIVSTDSQQIADTARIYGAEVHDRPAKLATDTASLDDALVDCVRSVTPVPDYVVTLQPTCPVRAPWIIEATVKLAQEADSAFTAYREPLCFLFTYRDGNYEPLGGSWVQHQQMRPSDFCWRFDGSVVVTKTESLLKHRRRVCGVIRVQANEQTVDIDTLPDLARADAMLRSREVA